EANHDRWSLDDAMRLADDLITDPYLETKSVGIEVVARFRRDFKRNLVSRWKRWLAGNHSSRRIVITGFLLACSILIVSAQRRSFSIIEATIPDMQRAMRERRVTS